MTDMDIIKAELQSLQKILEDKANIYLGPARTKLLSFANACSGALKLLKEQEARVLTLEEALGLDEDLCWIEINVGGADRNFGRWNDLYVAPDGISIVSEWAGQKNYLDAERYGKTWRCWNTRPTDEQRKAVKWDDKG